MSRQAAGVALAFCCALLAGCGGPSSSTSGAPSPAQRAQATHEYPSPPVPPQHARSPAAAPAAAVRRFAGTYINWDASDVTVRLRGLAQRSVGQARSAMELAAAQSARDYELQRGGVANHGTVEAVAPLPGHSDQYVVVTRERTTATLTTAYQGLRPAWHVALATVAQLGPGKWAVSGWQPQS